MTGCHDWFVNFDNVILDDGHLVQHLALLTDVEPASFKEALSSKVWKLSIKEELRSLEKNKTRQMVELPQNKVPISVK